MHTYSVDYAFTAGRFNAMVHRSSRLVSLISGSETEALSALKRQLNGCWKRFGDDADVIILDMKKV
jgi:hypothetical protein